MPRPSRGLVLQDFARDGEDLLDTLLATAQRPEDDASGCSTTHTRPTGFGSMPAVSEEGSSGSGRSPEPVHVDVASLQHYTNRVGPELRLMRQTQGRNREYYTIDHLTRLKQFEAQTPYNEAKCSDYCKDYHVQPCRACTTCHFCRQKTVDQKTYCPCYNSTKRIVGGKGRGFWCGSCLYIRMGENIHEVRQRRDWRCPCCRDICNCSGANCLRARRNLAVTNQLIHEATKQGFKSVAHYLILTHLSEQGNAMPMMDITIMRKRARPEEEDQLVDNPVFKQARMAYDMSQDARQRAGFKFHQTAAQHIRRQLQLLKAELPLPPESDDALATMAASGFGSHVLEDDQCEDEETEQSGAGRGAFNLAFQWGSLGQPQQQAGHNTAPHRPSWRSVTPDPRPAPFADTGTEEARRQATPGEAGSLDTSPAHVGSVLAQDGTTLPRASFAAIARGLAKPASNHRSTGIQSASNTLSSDTNTNPAMLGAAHARGPCPPGGHPHPHPGHPTDCILIDSSSPWDGPHPGLRAALGTPGNLRARTGPAPAPLGIVRLPANMIAARAKHVRPVRHSRQSRHQSSGAALQNGSSHHADLQSDAHRQQGPSGASVASTVSQQAPSHEASSMSHHTDQQLHQEQQQQQQQQQQSDVVDLTGQVTQKPGTTPSGSQERASGTNQPLHNSHVPGGATAVAAAQHGAPGVPSEPAHQSEHGPSSNGTPDIITGHVPEAAREPAEAEGQPAGQLGDLPDKPGHLGTAEQCRLANGGVCWHLLQMAVRSRQIAQKSDDDSVHQGYSDLVKGLPEKLTHDHSTSVAITASAGDVLQSPQAELHSGRTTGRTLACASHLKSHADLRYAVALLLLAAEALPEQDVEFTVCRLLFDQEPFVDFVKSDLQARAMLIKAAFDLFTIMQRRGIQVEGVCKGILHMLGSLTGEYAELLTRLAVDQEPLQIGHELHVGSIHMPPAMTLEAVNDQMAVMISLTMGNEDLLKVFLQYVQRCCSRSSPEIALHLLGRELTELLNASTVVRPEVRHGAMSAVYAAMTAAVQCDESGHAVWDADTVKALALHVQAVLIPPVEQLLLVDYPLRAPPAADAAPPTIGFKLDEVSVSLKVEVLARAHGLLAQAGLMMWGQIEMYATRPFHARTFWKHANTLYRHFTIFFLAHTLQANSGMAAFTAVAVDIVGMWLRTVLDDGKRSALKYFTLVVASNQHTRVLFRHVRHTQQALLADQTGAVRGSVVRAVLQEACLQPQWRSHVVDLLSDIDDVLAARSREVSATPAHEFEWETAASSICSAIVQAAGHLLTAHKTGPSGGSLLSVLLKRMASWVTTAAMYLQRCYQVTKQDGSASTAYMEGLDPGHRLSSIALARQALQASPLGHMATIFEHIMKACSNPAGQQPPSQTLAAQPHLLRPLHTLITACVETPTAAVDPNPVDIALYEALADALAPASGRTPEEEQQRSGLSQAAGVPNRAGSTELLQQQLLHLVLGTYLRRYLNRSSFGHAVHQRPAVNAVRFLGRLFQQPSLRGADGGACRALLPPLLAPMLEALCPAESGLHRPPSLPTKHALYLFLQGLLTDSPSLVPAASEPTATPSSTHFLNGPLQTGAYMDPDRFAMAMHVFLGAVCSDVLACVWRLCAPPQAAAGAQGGQGHAPVPQSPAHEMTPLTAQGCRSACSSLFTALGPPRSLDAIDALYLAHNNPSGSAASSCGASWPADFPWRLAETALAFLGALGSISPHGKHWLLATCPSLHRAMTNSPAHSRPLRPAYEKLLTVLQEQGISTALFQLAEQHPHRTPPATPLRPHRTYAAPPQHAATGTAQRPHTAHGRPPTTPLQGPNGTTHTPHERPLQQHAPEGGVLGGVQGGSSAQAGSAGPVVKSEGQDDGALSRQQVYAHDVPFHSIASLQRGDLVGLTGWVRRPPITKVRNNGDAVLLVDLEDELGDSVRIICLNAVRDRMQAVISQHSNQSHLPLVVSLTNVAVSKQRNTLQSTAATQVMHDSSGAAACRVRQHALQPSAQDRHSGMQTRMDRAVEPSSFQADEESQLPGGSSTQQSVAMSSQRTAQYHWGNTPQPLTLQHRQLPVLTHASSQLQVSTAGQEADSSASALGGQFSGHVGSARGAQQQQQQQQSGYAQQQQQQQQQQQEHRGYAQQQQKQSDHASLQKPRPPPSTSGLTADDMAKILTQLCDIANTNRPNARAALKQAIQENVRGKDAITNRAAEILLLS